MLIKLIVVMIFIELYVGIIVDIEYQKLKIWNRRIGKLVGEEEIGRSEVGIRWCCKIEAWSICDD